MIPLTLALLTQLAQNADSTRTVPAVLSFPETGMDDSAAYRGYRTRFWRDAAGNTVQVYLDRREGRVVHLWADADNESLGFTARDAGGRPAPLRWTSDSARVGGPPRARTLAHALEAESPTVRLGFFLLGSMRVERDFQAWGKHRAPYGGAPFALEETERLLAALDRLPADVRREHLALVHAPDVATLRARLRPTIAVTTGADAWVARVTQLSLDARDTLRLDVAVDPRRVTATRAGDVLTLRARTGRTVPFTVRIATTAAPLGRLSRQEIFTPEFLAFVAAAQHGTGTDTAALRGRWMERQVRGVELLSSRDKLMAGLPTYATYFGRDMLVTALMMRPIWRDEMSEFVIASALRKLSPTGQVSHEEALGGQAVREAASEYVALLDERRRATAAGNAAAADSLLARAAAVLRDHRRVRENYHMIDDELQLPVVTARWLADPDVPAARKRAFLLDATDGGEPRLTRMLRELALVARMTAPYAAAPTPDHLIGFAARDSARWAALSWRDSGVGYANGRYAMDVNAVWAPHALESMAEILAALGTLGFRSDSLAGALPELAAGTPLGAWVRDTAALRRAIDTWWGAERHFVVRLGPEAVRRQVAARLAIMPAAERAHWTRVLARTGADRDSLRFLALALDADARPIGVANSDPGTRLFLGEGAARAGAPDSATAAGVLRDVRLFVRAYPVGLFIDRVGPVVANDAYATPAVWRAFVRDAYHGPRVAWGREVNLFLLGVAGRIADAGADAGTDPARAAYVRELRDAADRVVAAVEASGFQSELWSYEFPGGRLTPVRYGSGADVQLWSTTDLAVQFALSRLRR
ncbi:hypothetical protein [Roseisolibacter agri]|uniref:Uncharacterized protein n=1 Tax=Roseisolibacter agri TaxID=2014610 RepID=A0AA37V073_9BACT|nr:hypothetical protein [Roseisolibacter agri]GLC23920.1 hypothetical protein rosag_04330 [Roseisolibacter agri]